MKDGDRCAGCGDTRAFHIRRKDKRCCRMFGCVCRKFVARKEKKEVDKMDAETMNMEARKKVTLGELDALSAAHPELDIHYSNGQLHIGKVVDFEAVGFVKDSGKVGEKSPFSFTQGRGKKR